MTIVTDSKYNFSRNSRLLAELSSVPDEAWEIRLTLAAWDYPRWLATQESFPCWADTDHWRGFYLYERGYPREYVPAEMQAGWDAAAQAEADAQRDWAENALA